MICILKIPELNAVCVDDLLISPYFHVSSKDEKEKETCILEYLTLVGCTLIAVSINKAALFPET